ncbi:germin-like protein 5-1 [Elaeis guineensis]|uniref:Germin-like protein 5-1 n=1 Tax=Elaeis guineensis var. tenera TaxID=51953 RepID=A0A6J0PBP7_ELAGV|nr:germin-like protein 5-1 [Elaeis guineensis]
MIEDDFFIGLASPGTTKNTMGSLVTRANVEKISQLNILSFSMSCINYAPDGLNPPHTHPRTTNMFFVLDGILNIGFVTITKGDAFMFPHGLVHFQKNHGDAPAIVIIAFNSQHPHLEKAIKVPEFQEYFMRRKGC